MNRRDLSIYAGLALAGLGAGWALSPGYGLLLAGLLLLTLNVLFGEA